MSMIYRTRVCDICEEWNCAADRIRQTMTLSKMVVSYGQPGFAEAVECAFKAMELKATYKARAEAAEGKVERVQAVVDIWMGEQPDDGSEYDAGLRHATTSAAGEIMEALNGK